MNAIYSLLIVALLLILVVGSAGLGAFPTLFGVVIPYAAFALFAVGFVYKILHWASVPVPFRIPTTSGQQKSLPWIKSSYFDNPHNTLGVIGRMALEVLFFRSLFSNSRSELRPGLRLTYAESKWLWAGAMVFHWSFLVILLRHFRFFVEPVPRFVHILQFFDGFWQIGVPIFYASGAALIAGAGYLLLRRLAIPQIRYISLPADYFPLFLILGIAGSGVSMRYLTKVDLIAVKELTMGLMSFQPAAVGGIGMVFYIHLFFVCALIAYFPFSKLMHLGGIFLSPTRNMANTNRMQRHINPWNNPVKGHTYEEYEDEFRDLMKGAGLPLEKEK
ncbi:MAG: sulfate reduction electron transfer complex DsrMKJOP subunit DsrM [Elusimicrobiota bacterium]